MSGIDNIEYIQSIDIYINALLSLCVSYDKVISILPDIETTCNLTQTETITAKDVLSANDKNLINKQELTLDAEKDEVQIVDNVQPVSFDEDLSTKKVTALDLIYGSDGEDEDYGDYEEDDYGSDTEGGSRMRRNKKYEQNGGNTTANIIDMRLSKPNPFVKIMEQADKDLFLAKSDKTGKFLGYSAVCDSAYGRQPVLMTQEEYKNNVEKEKEGIIDRYGKQEFETLNEDEQNDLIKQETQLDDRFIVT